MAMGSDDRRVAVIGAGSWGTALAIHLSRHGREVVLRALEPEVVEGIAETRHNPLFLSEFEVPESLGVTGDLGAAVNGADVIVSAVPVPYVRETLGELPSLTEGSTVVTVSKGIEADTLLTPHDILTDIGVEPERIVSLSGPSFARDVGRRHPVAVVSAGRDPRRAEQIQHLFASDRFRVYVSDDIVGVEIGGALKNVIALATGMSDGMELGDSARAGLITRGLAEITRIGLAVGGRAETFAGLSGMGDLALTCAGELSRNRRVGLEIGRGRTLRDVTEEMNEVAEGVLTTRSACALAQRMNVELPITEQVHRILFEDVRPQEVLESLLSRRLRPETWS